MGGGGFLGLFGAALAVGLIAETVHEIRHRERKAGIKFKYGSKHKHLKVDIPRFV